MTISGIIECSTCEHKIRLRHQVGYIYPVSVKIACNGCGKIIKGHVRKANPAFDFPNDIFHAKYEETTQTVSISTELPVLNGVSNIDGPIALSPFIGIGQILGFENVKKFELKTKEFISFYEKHYNSLITSFELFESNSWEHYLMEVKKHFRKNISLDLKTFEDCTTIAKEINKDFFSNLATDKYKTDFTSKLQNESIDKVLGKKTDLVNLKLQLDSFINLELEFSKGLNLVGKFLQNIRSFFPVIALSYNGNYLKQYEDKISLTTFEFLDLKELYIEQFEYLSRISALYFGLINLAERNNFDDFGSIPDCNELSDYFKKDNGIKKDIIKKHNVLNDYFIDTLNSQLRNGIGHLKTKYEAKNQLIKYFPNKAPEKVNIHKEIYLIDFAILVYEQALKVKDSLEIISKFVNVIK
ncbi:hypothetical protein BFP72_03755 [Reichenbachiella sp. 5M10]|uniref:hypothetical protein n=1 Tax=Reichenbachiella sp. 5M10 TaxID=1889772 RepID=UPI000C14FB70|nr:hypothetical protein [Reichenbachiella sp. 5M10]PIB34586.1 hypothetical protein BFP72_03755 [Reichenbachiella sp. 5M10]